MISILINALASLFLFVALYLIADLVRTIQKQRSGKNRPRPTQSKINPALEQRLLSMVAGDRPVAHRLVRLARRQQPGRSNDWYWEKAIYDLERDRH